jgi:maltose O-acetyltransferase
MKLIKVSLKYMFSWLLRILPTKYLRVLLLKVLGASIGKDVNVGYGIFLHMETVESRFSNLFLGNNVYIGPRTFIDLSGKVIIKDSAVVSMNCCILTHQDPGELKDRPMAKYYPKKILDVIIEEGAYIGANAIILPGVRIGKMSVIGAGSVVTKDVCEYTVVAGVPAKVIKKLQEDR